MTIRLLHSNNVTENRADIVSRHNDLFFDDQTNSILLPDPSGMLETKIGAASGTATGIKGFASGYVDAGQFVILDNIKATVATSGARGLSVASVSGSFTASISGHYMYSYSTPSGTATAYPGHTTTVTPSGSWFGWSFGNAGDTAIYYVNDYNNKKFYRITMMIGASYLNNFISIERLG